MTIVVLFMLALALALWVQLAAVRRRLDTAERRIEILRATLETQRADRPATVPNSGDAQAPDTAASARGPAPVGVIWPEDQPSPAPPRAPRDSRTAMAWGGAALTLLGLAAVLGQLGTQGRTGQVLQLLLASLLGTGLYALSGWLPSRLGLPAPSAVVAGALRGLGYGILALCTGALHMAGVMPAAGVLLLVLLLSALTAWHGLSQQGRAPAMTLITLASALSGAALSSWLMADDVARGGGDLLLGGAVVAIAAAAAWLASGPLSGSATLLLVIPALLAGHHVVAAAHERALSLSPVAWSVALLPVGAAVWWRARQGTGQRGSCTSGDLLALQAALPLGAALAVWEASGQVTPLLPALGVVVLGAWALLTSRGSPHPPDRQASLDGLSVGSAALLGGVTFGLLGGGASPSPFVIAALLTLVALHADRTATREGQGTHASVPPVPPDMLAWGAALASAAALLYGLVSTVTGLQRSAPGAPLQTTLPELLAGLLSVAGILMLSRGLSLPGVARLTGAAAGITTAALGAFTTRHGLPVPAALGLVSASAATLAWWTRARTAPQGPVTGLLALLAGWTVTSFWWAAATFQAASLALMTAVAATWLLTRAPERYLPHTAPGSDEETPARLTWETAVQLSAGLLTAAGPGLAVFALLTPHMAAAPALGLLTAAVAALLLWRTSALQGELKLQGARTGATLAHVALLVVLAELAGGERMVHRIPAEGAGMLGAGIAAALMGALVWTRAGGRTLRGLLASAKDLPVEAEGNPDVLDARDTLRLALLLPASDAAVQLGLDLLRGQPAGEFFGLSLSTLLVLLGVVTLRHAHAAGRVRTWNVAMALFALGVAKAIVVDMDGWSVAVRGAVVSAAGLAFLAIAQLAPRRNS
ncbi:hypothetical protein GCM10008955_10830 [Deinococcus malanensis]|uniref:DUF2339 domain-containing protein n=1 Tax=Deinococcus malanensis TaxID=1706855 RepID=A0ABQ2EPB6_9DEIO|nr:hypothetical protein [Deinococcus malanensis]GGK19204.1 hypothetical protein GCM10008955_10830 [Deinococcus malanensis]